VVAMLSLSERIILVIISDFIKKMYAKTKKVSGYKDVKKMCKVLFGMNLALSTTIAAIMAGVDWIN
jgi:hypothetical protein